jgi:hypothetical protein
MTEDAELERLRTAWASLPPSERGPGCAPPEEIWAAVQGEHPGERARTLIEHAVGCADCATLWRLARELSAAPADADAPERSLAAQKPARVLPFRRAVAVGAGLLAAAVVAFVLVPRLSPPAGPPAELRGTGGAELRMAPGTESVFRNRATLRWTGAPPGSRYAITVSTSDLTVLFRASGLTATEVEVPATALAGVPVGSQVLWRIEAILPDGTRLASPAFLTRIE